MPIQIQINSEPHQLVAPLSVTALIEHLDYQQRRIAIERNGELLPRSQYAETWLADGDELLIVQAIGGG